MSDPGYGFVPLAPEVRRVVRDEARWDRRVPGSLSGCIVIRLTTEQPVHIGNGSKQARPPHVVLRGARIRGRPGIPGSSLKGVLRARYEAITRSCMTMLWPGSGTAKIRSSTTQIKKARLTAQAIRAAVLDDNCTERLACPACALFGRMSLRSRITVTDLVAGSEISFDQAALPERFGPNLHHIGPRTVDRSGSAFEVHSLDGRKFHGGHGPAAAGRQHVETIPAGTVLTGQLRLFNVTPAEAGGLFAALGCDPPSTLKLGGGKAHGFGRTRCEASAALRAVDSTPLDPARWRDAFLASADRWADGELGLVALHHGGR